MIKKVYSIYGFDCANCAAKTERHLNKNLNISKATLDFAGDKLYVTYKDKELTIDELLTIIAEVETETITISEAPIKKKQNIFTKDLWILLARVIFGVIVIVLSFTVLAKEEYFWYNFALYIAAILVLTYDIFYKVINHIIHKENPIDEFLLITISVLGAFTLASVQHHAADFMEAVMVVALFQIGRVIEGIATNKSKDAINSALDLRSETANLINGSEIEIVSPSTLKVGDIVLVKTGELIPIDGEVIEGEGYLDTSSLTGEFIPLRRDLGDEVFSGSLLKDGTLKIKVTKQYSESTVSKLIELISHSGEHKSKADKFVTKFARFYTPIVFIVSMLVGILGGAISGNWYDYLLLGLKMLVVACPCAIVISVPMAYFSAIGLASKNGIVIKGTNYLDEINRVKKVIMDKTGTLTKGSFSIREIHAENNDEKTLMKYLIIGETLSNHPIGKAIVNGKDLIDHNKISEYKETPGYGISCFYENKRIFAGNFEHLKKNSFVINEVIASGIVVYCGVENKYLGYVILGDEIKEESYQLVRELNDKNIKTILLSGDKEENVKYLANELGINVYKSSLLPEEKNEILLKEKSNSFAVAYIGDGVNDAASIKASDVGFAMGGIGSDIAVSNADVVIMNDNPIKVRDAIKIAAMARHTAIFNIVAALAIKFGIEIAAIVTSSLGRGELIPMWAAVLADTGLTVVLIINSLLLLYRKVTKKRVK